jgi:hypothetical protein
MIVIHLIGFGCIVQHDIEEAEIGFEDVDIRTRVLS